jgi:hypothetical protein
MARLTAKLALANFAYKSHGWYGFRGDLRPLDGAAEVNGDVRAESEVLSTRRSGVHTQTGRSTCPSTTKTFGDRIVISGVR